MAVLFFSLLISAILSLLIWRSESLRIQPKTSISLLQGRSSLKYQKESMFLSETNWISRKSFQLQMSYNVGIVGATGAVGEEILSVLQKRNFPINKLNLFTSDRSAGISIITKNYGNIITEEFSYDIASKCDVILLAVSGEFALQWAEKLANNGCLVIDNSSAFRYKIDIPLVIPEINIKSAIGKKLISNPNCTTSIALMALWPIHLKYKIKKLIISTYQAASGAGSEGMKELQDGMKATCNGEEIQNKIFAHPLPYNLIPHIDVFQENLYTKEEMKVAWEARKIMDSPDLKVSVTAVRIPTLRAHSEAITIETESEINPDDVRELLRSSPGVKVIDEPLLKKYPMPLTATGQFDIEVGRIRQSLVFDEHGIDLFVCGDQLLRGAALNAVLIAEEMLAGASK